MPHFPRWDEILLTAADEAQADAYRRQITLRRERGVLPAGTHFAVLPDPDGMRIGSGGATLQCLQYAAHREGGVSGKRILVIHSGGDSKRVPQYSACGKLFSPVPRPLDDGGCSTLFDELLAVFAPLAPRVPDGMLVCSGDVLLLFDVARVDLSAPHATALTLPVEGDLGCRHGVFLPDGQGHAARFLHKQPLPTLRETGAVDASGRVLLDTGAVLLRREVLQRLLSLLQTPNGADLLSPRARLSFYGDFLYPLASESTHSAYLRETPEGEFTPELLDCREALWEALSPCRLALSPLENGRFVHFGTSRELRSLMTEQLPDFRALGWRSTVCAPYAPDGCTALCSLIDPSARIGRGCFIEESRVLPGAIIGEGCILSGVTVSGAVPAGTVLHALPLRGGRFICRMYAVSDDPKQLLHMDSPLPGPLWETPLFPVCATREEAVARTLSGDTSAPLMSLAESFREADQAAMAHDREALLNEIRRAAPHPEHHHGGPHHA